MTVMNNEDPALPLAVPLNDQLGAAGTRRYGRFTAPARWAHEFRTELKRVMGLCIVFRAEHLFHSDEIEYWAASEHFRPLPLGEMVPEYRWHFTDDGDIWAEEQPF